MLTEDQMQTIHKRGVLVVPNILTPKECTSTVSGVWDHLEYASSEWKLPIDRNNKTTWRGMKNFSPMHGMLIQHHGIGHMQPAADIRQNAKVHQVFAHLHGDKDLITSLDGVSISLPPEVTNLGWTTARSSWAHCDTTYDHTATDDQILHNKTHPVYQSWVTPLDVHDGDATLAVLVGSHLYHQDLANKFQLGKDTWKLNAEHLKYLEEEKGCAWEFVQCKAGSMVLWDSRAVHYGAQPKKQRANQTIRMCFYVCMVPRSWATSAKLKKKVKAFEESRLTTHDPVASKLFPKGPRKWPGEELEVPKTPKRPTLTPLGRRLVGYSD